MKKDIEILEELAALNAGSLQHAGNNNYYSVPEGYFNNLASDIIAHIKVETIPVANLYFVPENYFETLPGLILDKVQNDSVLASFSKKELFSVPENYFEHLSSNILQKIKSQNNSVQQELEEIAPLLSSIPKTNVYSTPEGYFENVVPAAFLKDQPAKVISFKTKTRHWVSYAAAACVAAVLSVGGYLYIHNDNGNISVAQLKKVNVQQQIAQLSDDQINNYLINDKSDIYVQPDDNKQNIDVQSLLNNASDQEIENYLIENSEPDEPTKGS